MIEFLHTYIERRYITGASEIMVKIVPSMQGRKSATVADGIIHISPAMYSLWSDCRCPEDAIALLSRIPVYVIGEFWSDNAVTA